MKTAWQVLCEHAGKRTIMEYGSLAVALQKVEELREEHGKHCSLSIWQVTRRKVFWNLQH